MGMQILCFCVPSIMVCHVFDFFFFFFFILNFGYFIRKVKINV